MCILFQTYEKDKLDVLKYIANYRFCILYLLVCQPVIKYKS